MEITFIPYAEPHHLYAVLAPSKIIDAAPTPAASAPEFLAGAVED
jgi:hypothetical protein